VKDLMEMVNEEEKMAGFYDRMISTYRNEDLNALYNLTLEDAASKKEVEMLLTKRNREWISRIESLSAEVPTFYGVGAAHLGGEDGLVNLLRREGYEVTPLF
jgi:uncharacterized protein YbaP (TraB family)